MKFFINGLRPSTGIGYFEKIFLNNNNYISSSVEINSGKMSVYDWFDDRVILTTYVTSTGGADGEFIQFGIGSVRESSGVGNVGSHLVYLSTSTVIPFAYTPINSSNEWIPYHGIKTTFAVSGTRALIYVDGVSYDIYDTGVYVPFTEIIIDQHIYGMVTPDGIPISNPSRENGVVELTSRMTIKPQQMRMDQSFLATDEINYTIGYSPMWSSDGNDMKYQLLQNGNKFIFSGVDGQQYYNTDIYEFGFNSDIGYGNAVITKREDGVKWLDKTLCDRYATTSQSGAKVKLYFENLRSDVIPIGSVYTNDTKYIWGRADGFMDIYNNAPIENP